MQRKFRYSDDSDSYDIVADAVAIGEHGHAIFLRRSEDGALMMLRAVNGRRWDEIFDMGPYLEVAE